MTNEWPRFGTTANSVTEGFLFCSLKAALAMLKGRVLSFSPSMISKGPRSEVRRFTFGFRPGIDVCKCGLKQRHSRTWNCIALVEILGLVFTDRVGEGKTKLTESERHCPTAIQRIRNYGRRRFQRRERQRKDAPEWSGINRHRSSREPSSCDDLSEKPSKRVPNDHRLLVKFCDHFSHMVRDLSDGFVGKDARGVHSPRRLIPDRRATAGRLMRSPPRQRGLSSRPNCSPATKDRE